MFVTAYCLSYSYMTNAYICLSPYQISHVQLLWFIRMPSHRNPQQISARSPCPYFPFHKEYYHIQSCIFFFKGPKSVALVSLPSLKFVPPPSHFYVLQEITLYGVRMSSNSIMVIPRGVQNSQKSRRYIKILRLISLK